MSKLNVLHLVMVTSLLLLSSCASTSVHNIAPEPYFPSCEAVCDAARADSPDANWRDLKNMTVTMLQLRERQEADERQPFGKCDCPK